MPQIDSMLFLGSETDNVFFRELIPDPDPFPHSLSQIALSLARLSFSAQEASECHAAVLPALLAEEPHKLVPPQGPC